MGKDKAATTVANTMKRRLHMEGKKIKPSILDFTSESIFFFDLRPENHYTKYHIRHAFHVPACLWADSSVPEFAQHLKNIYFKEIFKNICSTFHHHDHLGNLDF